MRDRDNHTNGSSSQHPHSQPGAANGSGEHGHGPSNAHQSPKASPKVRGKIDPEAAATEGVTLSRRWAGPGSAIDIAIAGRDVGPLKDWRVLWGFHHGGDGYTLLPVENTEGKPHGISFTVPSVATPGVYVIQLEHGRDYLRRVPFIVTAQDPPLFSPFRILRTEPASGTLRMYQTYCRYRSHPDKAIEVMAEQMKGYDTFFDSMPDDPKFHEILERNLTPFEKRKRFASWLVTNQIKAEHEE
ncbi:MAG: hypothetical protein WBW04_05885 [Nitrolancea sp.]